MPNTTKKDSIFLIIWLPLPIHYQKKPNIIRLVAANNISDAISGNTLTFNIPGTPDTLYATGFYYKKDSSNLTDYIWSGEVQQGLGSIGVASNAPLSIVTVGNLGSPRYTFAHEIGHLLMARHNRVSNGGDEPDDASCNFGYRYPILSSYGYTIMAKLTVAGAYRILYYRTTLKA